jgi:hypothetical protein
MLRDRIFFVLWLIWLVIGILLWGIWLASLPCLFEHAATGTLPNAVVNGLSPAELALTSSAAWNTSVATWVWINTAVNGLTFLVFSLVALFIWLRLRTGFGLLTAYVLLLSGSAFMSIAIYGAELSTTTIAAWELGGIIWPLFFIWIYLFPNGQAVPRHILWVFGPLVVMFATLFLMNAATIFMADSTPLAQTVSGLQPIVEFLIFPLLLLVIGAQIYRYFRISKTEAREQTKWFLFGLLIAFIPPTLLGFILDYPAELDTISFMVLPIGIGISILRYRLWDIDLIIRRTLQYTLLTGLLVLVYFGSVVLLQGLAENLTGQQSPIVIVISTLAIAALFNPSRMRIQDFIDRRFYRQKYDAEQTLANFATVSRDEVDMDKLTTALLGVIDETMQPERVSIWLPPVARLRPARIATRGRVGKEENGLVL